MNIKIKKHLLLYKGYKLKCSLGKSGIRKKKKEGDLATPKGSFGIGNLYYRKDRLKKFKCKINTTGKLLFLLSTVLKNYTEKIIFMIYLLI